MKRRHTNMAAPANGETIPDPLDSLVLWLIVLEGEDAQGALNLLGLDKEELERIKRENPQLLKRMRKLGLAGQRLMRNELATLLRARLGEELMRCRDAKSMALLTTAMGRMQGWMFWKKWEASYENPTEAQLANGETPRAGDRLPGTALGVLGKSEV